ncbi:MAG TPA: bifunctional oligoribonuclease/PAP phosphatase NrnA [Bacteroidota bacterium]|nr:bifunctional oligoribonuclease/PAP phosphatase NrnA [Bacteroidota bacterium]
MTPVFDAILPLFRQKRRFVLTTHVNPDGDGIGSQLALAIWLRSQGKDFRIINHSPTPAVYRFLDPEGWISAFDPERDKDAVAGADVIAVLDTNQPERLRSMREAVLASKALKVCIDHHLDPDPFAAYTVIDEDATSTGEMLYRLLLLLKGPALGADIASALYCAIMTDTGSFRYPRVDPEIHTIVAHLIECGADPVQIYREVYERWSSGRIRLLGATLATLKTEFAGRLAHISITEKMLAETGTTEEDTDTFTSYPMSVDGVRAAVLFLELPEGVKISFRSKGNIPINELAQEFGGNGHKNAAGARVEEHALAAVRARVLAAAGKYVDERRAP